ncbi:MAG: hypothetical protein AAFR51_07945 [Pseudomonadota bacterium]
MSKNDTPFQQSKRPKDALSGFKAARLRGNFYSYKREAAENSEKAKAFSNASDDQGDREADLMSVIIRSKAYDLADVHAKLVLLCDSFRRHFEKPDFVAQDQAKLLRDSIEWIETSLAFENEKTPVEVEQAASIENQQAA